MEQLKVVTKQCEQKLCELPFTGTVFIEFDDVASMDGFKQRLQKLLKDDFNRPETGLDRRLKPSRWRVRYAPARQEIMYEKMRGRAYLRPSHQFHRVGRISWAETLGAGSAVTRTRSAPCLRPMSKTRSSPTRSSSIITTAQLA